MLDVLLRHTLDHLAIDIRFQTDNELVVLFGPSGAGKSFTLRAIAGLVRPHEGRISVNGRLLFDSQAHVDLPPQERRVGYVPQHYGLFPHLSVWENVAYGLFRLDRAERERRVGEMLELMRLRGYERRKPEDLSGGEQQRVALARALVTSPDLLLLDEPFGALDAPLREHLRQELRRLRELYAIPTILVTHDLAEAYTLAQRIVVMAPGRVLQVGTRDEVFRAPVTPDVARAVGMRNVFTGQVVASDREGVRIAWAGGELRARPGSWRPGQTVCFGFRPEEVLVTRRPVAGEAEADQMNRMRAVIVDDEPFGLDHLLQARLVDAAAEQAPIIYVRMPHPVFLRLDLHVGDERVLAVSPSVVHIFPEPCCTPSRGGQEGSE